MKPTLQIASDPAGVTGVSLRRDRVAQWSAGLLGFCLPLSGELTLSQWLPGYPDQVTPIRVVTFAVLAWVLWVGRDRPLPSQSRRMITAFIGVLSYAAISLIWTPVRMQGLHELATVGAALATGVTLLLLVGRNGRALSTFARGALLAGLIQVGVAMWELSTGNHLASDFGALSTESYGVSVQVLFGPVAWGSMGNPNDLGGVFLTITAVFLSHRAYGLRLSRLQVMLGYAATSVAAVIGFTSLNDARAFRLGLLAVVAMHALDWLISPRRSLLRTSIVLLFGWLAFALLLLSGGAVLSSLFNERSTLFSTGLKSAYLSGGFGRGLGAEKSMVDSGEIATNLHNIVASLANDLGLVVAAAFLSYLVFLVGSWAFVTRSAHSIGAEAALARAALAVTLLLYGSTSSGVLESPVYWAFFAATALLSTRIQDFSERDRLPR